MEIPTLLPGSRCVSSYYSQIFGAVDVCDVCHSRYYCDKGPIGVIALSLATVSHVFAHIHLVTSMMICRLNVVLHFGLMGTSPSMLLNLLNDQALGLSSLASRKIGHLVLINGAVG